jgi:hypothetical protein
MKRFIIGVSAAALLAIPALAIATKDHHGMHAPQTRAEVEARVKAHFAEVDKNKDGAITKDEADSFRAAKREEMRDKRFASMDANKDGQISRQEYDAPRGDMRGEGNGMPRMYHRGMGMMMGRHGDMFAKADANSDGKVTLSEATGKALEMFDRADANKDGTVTPEERRAGWKNWAEQRRDKVS